MEMKQLRKIIMTVRKTKKGVIVKNKEDKTMSKKNIELINNIIENEYRHISEFEECNDQKENKNYKNNLEVSEKLLNQLKNDLSEENKEVLDDIESAINSQWLELCKYYFKKGVIAGTTNLDFLKDTQIMRIV